MSSSAVPPHETTGTEKALTPPPAVNDLLTTEKQQTIAICGAASGKPCLALVYIRFAIETVGLALLCIAAIIIYYQFGWMYGVPAVILAIIAILLTKVGWRWFYIAAKTTPRDVT